MYGRNGGSALRGAASPQFRILGPLEVVQGERRIDLGRRKQRALLAILLVRVDRVVPVDLLIEELWAGHPPSQSMASLQAYVSNLRRVLEPGRRTGDPPRVLVSQPPGYRLVIPTAELDAAVFEGLAAEGRRLLEEGRHGDAATVLARGLALWRGPVLADFTDAPLVESQRARLEELRLAALEDRVAADLALGRHTAVVAELEQLVAAHPFRERLHGLRILALYRSGRQAEALQTYRDTRRTLREELGIEPSPGLRRLETEILRQSPRLDWTPSSTGGAVPPAAGGAVDDESRGTGFVGRQEHLAAGEAMLAGATAGQGGILLVAGEPGIGKTRLAEEIARQAAAVAVRVVWGRCQEGAGSPVFWPWVQVARRLVAEAPPERRRALLGPAGLELVPLIPELTELVPALPAARTSDPESAWLRRYQAFIELLRRMCADRPLVVVLDDLHWADVPTLRQLVLLAGELAGTPLLVLGTYRDIEVDQGHPLAESFAALTREPTARRVTLPGLGRADVARLMATQLDVPPDDRLAALVHDRTGGNPFFVVELIRLLVSEGRLRGPRAEAAVAREIPVGVREVIRRRLARLPEQTGAVLLVAAVAGRRFQLDVLRCATGLSEDATLDALEAGLVSGLVVEDADIVGCYWFTHALVREAIYEDVSRARRARLHARVAKALQQRPGGTEDATLELAHHWFLAAPSAGAELAVPYVLSAAEQAIDRLAYEEAERQLGRALNLLASMPGSPERSRTELSVQMRLGAVLLQRRGPGAPETTAAMARARELVDEVADDGVVLTALRGLHEAATMRGKHREARELADRILRLAERSGQPASLAVGHITLGRTLYIQGFLADARVHLERGVQLGAVDAEAERWPVPLPVFGQILLGATLELLGEAAEAAAAVDAAIRRADAAPPLVQASAMAMGANAAVLKRDRALARERAEAALSLARRWQLRAVENYTRTVLGWVRALDGDPTGALEPLRRTVAELEAGGARLMVPVLAGLLAEVELLAGQPDAALDRLDGILAGIERTDERFYEAEFHRLRGEALRTVAPPRPREATRALNTAIAIARRQSARLLERRALASLRDASAAGDAHSSR